MAWAHCLRRLSSPGPQLASLRENARAAGLSGAKFSSCAPAARADICKPWCRDSAMALETRSAAERGMGRASAVEAGDGMPTGVAVSTRASAATSALPVTAVLELVCVLHVCSVACERSRPTVSTPTHTPAGRAHWAAPPVARRVRDQTRQRMISISKRVRVRVRA